MYKRAQELFEIWAKKAWPGGDFTWDELLEDPKRAWYEVALAEAELADHVADNFKGAIHSMKAEIATMVKRKHYNDAIKSLAICQQQIETLVVELKRWNPTSRIAQDAATVMDLLEAMITANPDMQTEEWKADQKIKQDQRDAEYRVAEEKRRAAVQAKMWEGTVTADEMYGNGWEMADKAIGAFSERMKWNKENVRGAVGSSYKPDIPSSANGPTSGAKP